MSKILILTCGGTIDKIYGTGKGSYDFEIGEPAIKRILENIRLNDKFEILRLLKKDSLDMTNEDRQKIKQIVENTDYKKIIITHGTDTMVDTAKVLRNVKDKTIVLFGSSLPEIFKNTDAHINFGFALGVLKSIDKPGVFVCMNGKVFEPGNVVKTKEGIFKNKY